MDESDETSVLSRKVKGILKATLTAAEKRQGVRLPQPLFWSLFHAELAEVKKEKARRRLLDSILSDK